MKKNFVWMAIITTIGVIGLGNIVISNAEISREQKRIEQEQQKAEEEKKEMEQTQANNTVATEQPKTEEFAPQEETSNQSVTEQPKQETVTPPPTVQNNGGDETIAPPPSQPTNTTGEGRRFIINNDNLKYGITIVSSYVKEGNSLKTTHIVTNNYHMKGTFTNITLVHKINGGTYSTTTSTPINTRSGETQTFEVIIPIDNIENVIDYQASITKILEILD
ncbi:MAG: hypothetical protein ACRDD7_02735 [Peptostreptococcaceae bacterium]